MAVEVKQCKTCVFWERKRINQWLGTCLNPDNYPIKREFNDGCKGHKEVEATMEMQSNTRG